MKKTWEEVAQTMTQRRLTDSVLKKQMISIRDRVNGDIVIPLADVDGQPSMPVPTPHLIADSIESNALRAASTTPIIHCPALDPTSSRSQDRAHTRRRALYSAWDYSALLEMLLPRGYRHLVGYGTNSFCVVPDFDTQRARIETRDPLTAYPSHRSAEDAREPMDVGFVYGRSPQWIMSHYPESRDFFYTASERIGRGNPRVAARVFETLWDVVEWIDEDQCMIGILGPREQLDFSSSNALGAFGYHLRTWDNRAGMVPVAAPRRVTLDRIEGQVSKLTGMVDLMGRLTALDVLAAEKAIFPDMVVLDANGTPQLLNASGRWNDGRTGEANLVKASKVDMLQSSPGPLTHPVIDRLERSFRLSGGMPGILGGVNDNSLRSGNALDTMSSISVDPRIQEVQRLMTRALKVVNEAVVEVEKGYFPNKKQVFFSGWPGDLGHVEYTPAKDFDSKENAVAYPFPGSDINQLTVALGQAVGTGLISKKSARNKHPLSEDPDFDERQILAEQMENALSAAMLQQATAGTLPLIDLASIMDSMFGPTPVTEAIKKADAQARNRQAAPPDSAQAPEAQPGLAQPGMGAESAQPPPELAGPNQSQMNFSDLVRALRSGSRGASPVPR